MHMAIAIFFFLVITSLLAFAAYYECEHFAENHKKPRKAKGKAKGAMRKVTRNAKA